MKNNDLISMWREINAENEINQQADDRIFKMKHSKMFTKVLLDQKMKIILYSAFFGVYLSLMIYAYIYLRLDLTIYSNTIFSAIGIFLVYKITSETGTYKVLAKTADNVTIKESTRIFLQTIKRMVTIDFISFFLLLYSLATTTIILYLKDIGGINNVSFKDETGPLMFVFIVIILYIPWFLRYVDMRKYRKLNSSLKDCDY